MKKRILISIVAIALCFVICLVTTASTPISTATAFIDEELKAAMENATADELIPVDIWITEVDTNKVETEVMKAIGDTKVSLLSANATTAVTHAQVDTYIQTEREIYAEMQTEKSQTFLNRYNGIFNLRSSSEEKLTYVSKYAPVISAKLTVKEINQLSKDLSVESIYYIPNTIDENCSNISFPLVNANYVRDTLGYSGSGIKIGMIERAMPNKNASYFTTSNIILDPSAVQSSNTDHKAHANLVASIMVAKATTSDGITYKGIAPNAKLYATCYDGTSADRREHTEWLLTQGVNVINMSAGGVGNGTYTSNEKWLDHIAINHSVHFVVAAGNHEWDENGNFIQYSDYIHSPAMSYNAIAVGNLNDKNTSAQEGDELWSTSSYIEANGCHNKPDLVAPGTSIATAAGTGTGTSFAAPHVTAIIAQLCQAYPTLKTKQDAMKAILTASITHSVHAYNSHSLNFDKYGAGMVDANVSMNTIANGRYVSSSFAANAADGSTKRYSFTVPSSNKKVRISLAWLKYATISSGDHSTSGVSLYDLTDLDLYVYNSSNEEVAFSYSAANNVEIVQLDNPPAGTYTIEIKIHESSAKSTYFGLAWQY